MKLHPKEKTLQVMGDLTFETLLNHVPACSTRTITGKTKCLLLRAVKTFWHGGSSIRILAGMNFIAEMSAYGTGIAPKVRANNRISVRLGR